MSLENGSLQTYTGQDGQARAISPWPSASTGAICAIVLVLLFYFDTATSTVSIWEKSAAYGHGFLVLPISLFLVWRTRRRIARLVPEPKVWGLAVLLGVGTCWVIAHTVDVLVLKQLCLLLIIGVVIWTILGHHAAKILAFPLMYLLLAIPIWSIIIPILQENTAIAAATSLQLMGIPVFLDGFYLSIPSGQFVVAEVCAGLRFLLVNMAITSLYAHLHFRALWQGAVFVFVGILLSVVFNWIRVLIIILVGHITDMQHAIVQDHIAFGWIIFGIGLLPLHLLGVWLRKSNHDTAKDGDNFTQDRNAIKKYKQSGLIRVSVAAVMVSAFAPAAAYCIDKVYESDEYTVTIAPIKGSGAWFGPVERDGDWHPKFVGKDAEILRVYEKGLEFVTLYVAYYGRQKQGAEVINDLNVVFGATDWILVGQRYADVGYGKGNSVRVQEIEVRSKEGVSRLIWQWYFVGGRFTANPNTAKLLQLWGLLQRRRGAAVIAVARDNVTATSDRAREVLESFTRDMAAPILERLSEISVVAAR